MPADNVYAPVDTFEFKFKSPLLCVTVNVVERFETDTLPPFNVMPEAVMFARFALKVPFASVSVLVTPNNTFPFATNVPPDPLIVNGKSIVLPLYVIASVPDVPASVVAVAPAVKVPPDTGNVRLPLTLLARLVNVPAKFVKSKSPIFPLNATDSVAVVVFRPNPVPAVATFTFGAYCSAIVPKLIVFVIAPVKLQSTSKLPVQLKLVPIVVSQSVDVVLFNNNILPLAPKSKFLLFVFVLLNNPQLI